jgi:hypothetical protein
MSETAPVANQTRILSRTAFSGLICLLLAVAVSCFLVLSHTLVVISGSVVPGWQLGLVLLVPAVVLSVVSTVLPHRANAAAPRPGRVRAGFSSVFRSRKALIILGVGYGLFNLLMAGAELINSTRYAVLEPSGPGECRIVIRGTFFTLAKPGSGLLYRVRGDWGLAVRDSQAEYGSDTYIPLFWAENYRLTWDGTSGQLLATSGWPSTTDPIPVSCPR